MGHKCVLVLKGRPEDFFVLSFLKILSNLPFLRLDRVSIENDSVVQDIFVLYVSSWNFLILKLIAWVHDIDLKSHSKHGIARLD